LRVIAPRGLQAVYDPGTIIAAVAGLRGRLDFSIVLLGEGPEAEAVENKIKDRSLNDLITVKPFLPHDQFALSLKNYHIYLSASLSDSTSVALLEAMTVGLFPVVSDIAGNREWIEDGTNGVTFEPGSALSLAEAVIRADRMRNRFGEAAEINRARIERDAIWQDNMQRVKNIFLGLIHE
jgi:glycosyltransferase involved in cell wall biosynthesis